MELWRAQAGSGKTEAVLALIAETVRATPLARVWVVLPSSRQRAQFRERLLAHLREADLPAFNVELFNFYSLNRRLLNLMRVPVRSLRGGARQAVLRRVALNETLAMYGAVAGLPGFSRAVGQLIAELKQTRVEAGFLRQTISTPKDEDLAKIYEAYQLLLRDFSLVDTEGEAWLALETLNNAPEWDAKVAVLAVDGFDQFTDVQAQVIRALDKRAARTVVTLTAVEGREDGVGRRFTSAEIALGAQRSVVLLPRPHPQPAVRHLLDHGFRLGGATTPMETDSAATLTLIEAHSPSAEAAEVMRQIKRRLITDRAAPDSIMVVVRDWTRYQPALSAAAHEFGVPVSLQAGMPLARHPLAAALNAILTLPETKFAFEAVIEALRSPYIRLEGLPPELLIKVEAAARAFHLRHGRDSWEQALDDGARPRRDHRDRELPPILTPDEARDASEALARLFDALPTSEDKRSVWEFVGLVDEIIGADPDSPDDGDAKLAFTLDIAAQVRRSAAVSDDLAALRAIKEALTDLLLTEDLLAALSHTGIHLAAWREFLGDFRASLDSADLSASPDRSGRVLITTATDARGSAHPHVYILGLSEGIFPAPLPPDALYLNSERLLLQRDGRPILRSAADRADDDSVLFELLAQARESLTVSRPSLNGGQAWPPSALWNAVTATLTPSDLHNVRIRIAPGRPPAAGNAASLPELAAAIQSQSAAYHAYMHTYDAQRSAHVAHAQRIERSRILLAETGNSPDLPGNIGDLRGTVEFSNKLSRADYLWSASTLGSLASCAYRVFAEKLLGLTELEDPSEGADAALEGSLMHLILQAVYAGFQSSRHPIAPENLDEALDLLETAAADIFENAVANRELIPSAVWPQQQVVIKRTLSELVRRDFSANSPVRQAFGSGTRWTIVREKTFGDEPHRPLTISVPLDSGPVDFRLTGTIDRVDCIDDGQTLRLVVVDYKRSGTDISPRDIAEGRSTQIVLYMEALRQLLAEPNSPDTGRWFSGMGDRRVEIGGGLFWGVRTGKPLHVFTPEQTYTVAGQKLSGDGLCALTLKGIAERIEAVRGGDFRPLPHHPADGKCAGFCSFADLCRVCEMM